MDRKTITHGSIFTAVGAFDLAAKYCGWETVFQVENDEWCRGQLEWDFKTTKRYKDIKSFKGKEYKGKIDVLSGGRPQDLWKDYCRVIDEIKPKYVLIETEAKEVRTSLEKIGYEANCNVIPSQYDTLPHHGVWVVAYPKGEGKDLFKIETHFKKIEEELLTAKLGEPRQYKNIAEILLIEDSLVLKLPYLLFNAIGKILNNEKT